MVLKKQKVMEVEMLRPKEGRPNQGMIENPGVDKNYLKNITVSEQRDSPKEPQICVIDYTVWLAVGAYSWTT